ncbi:MAG TPA: family 1 encapsulin nanocompartment shell protein [Acidimicrobiales bacterium]|nr:family 1 encapsulin nanocompartment shell protein [Acidimicrobiales bacterium]
MDHLLHDLAPISCAGWEAIEDEAKSRLTTYLAARKLVDFVGPHGWDHSSTNLGRVAKISKSPTDGVTALQRRVLPLVELRAVFTVSRAEIDDIDRGAAVDLADLDHAAKRIALAENIAVFHGYKGADIKGITEVSSHAPVAFDGEFEHSPTAVAKAVDLLRQSGVDGPYGLAIGPVGYTGIIETTEHGGLLLLDHLRQILGGPVVWAPGVEEGVVLSLRGGDFHLESGQDLSIGYIDHDADKVHLYFEESFSFHVLEPDAAVSVRLVRS